MTFLLIISILCSQVGDGVQQDFHLAKRFFDLAAEVDHKAKTPRDLALLVMQGHKSLLHLLGPDFLSKFRESGELLETLDKIASVLLDGLRKLDQLVHSFLDLCNSQLEHLKGQLLDIIHSIVPAPVRYQLLHALDVTKTQLKALYAASKNMQSGSSIKEIVIEPDELLVLLLFVATFFTLFYIRNQRRRRALHAP
jgi:TPR repeat protein